MILLRSFSLLRSALPVAVLACAAPAVVPAALASSPTALTVAQADANAEPNAHPASTDAGPSRNAARSRLRECGHQWSGMKKSGAAAGMTWKDYSQSCLAKQ